MNSYYDTNSKCWNGVEKTSKAKLFGNRRSFLTYGSYKTFTTNNIIFARHETIIWKRVAFNQK